MKNCLDCQKPLSSSPTAKRCKQCYYKYRSLVMRGKRPSVSFPKGHVPWNKGIKWPRMNGKNHPMYGTHPVAWNKGLKGVQIAWNKGKKCPQISAILKGKKHTEEAKKKMSISKSGSNHPFFGKKRPKFSREWLKNMSDAKRGTILSEEVKKRMSLAHKGKVKSAEHRRRLGDSNRGKKRSIEIRLNMMGANCHFWKGGITPINTAIRMSYDYRLWREAVLKRDNYTCQICGIAGSPGNFVLMHADHIKPFSLFPELRFAIDNGRALCVPCHEKTPTYLNPRMKIEDFIEK